MVLSRCGSDVSWAHPNQDSTEASPGSALAWEVSNGAEHCSGVSQDRMAGERAAGRPRNSMSANQALQTWKTGMNSMEGGS